MKTSRKVLLIVDNPLRDLDGLVMLGWRLAQEGYQAYLVPMYDQAFAVDAIRPDVVIANYIRPNNLGLLRRYKAEGARIGVVDTEGAIGQSADDLAHYAGRSGGLDMVDFYSVWGEGQHRGFIERGLTLDGRLHLTGCPRYDYCGPQWRGALAKPRVEPGFVLINTNFVVNNPRFSAGPEAERATLLRMGADPAYVEARVRDEERALKGVCDLMDALAKRFPDQRFVLRPHPFEDPDYYAPLTDNPNFIVRQEGTSIEWINASAAMIHLNCSTAVEAVMLGREALSPQWLDTPALHIAGPAGVSRHFDTPEALGDELERLLKGMAAAPSAELVQARDHVIREFYLAIDGEASDRIAKAVVDCLSAPARTFVTAPQSPRARLVRLVQHGLGRNLWFAMRERLDRDLKTRRAAKAFEARAVQELLTRINALGRGRQVEARAAGSAGGALGSSVLIERSAR